MEKVGKVEKVEKTGKSIAIFGTHSNTGKTTISIAMCKLFAEMGLNVYPFKAFNLSGNSFMYGKYEIGYAQYVQALACGKDYERLMNPVLKKFVNGKKSYIINGIETEVSPINEIEYLRETASKAYENALKTNDLVIVEGSGSCAELNLKRFDVGNMHFALKHKIPIIIVTDISNGGVFASLYGTIKLLSEEERKLVKAIIVNKFSGNVATFNEGKQIIEEICGVKVISIMPCVDVNFPEEDGKQNANIDTCDLQESIEKLVECFKQNIDLETLKKIIEENVK